MGSRRPWRLLLHVVAATSVSCTFVTDSCACVLAPPVGVVYGTVALDPVEANAQLFLELRSHAGSCGSASAAATEDHASQLVTPGPYRTGFVADTGRRCATVTLRKDARMARDSVTVHVSAARADSARLDITLR